MFEYFCTQNAIANVVAVGQLKWHCVILFCIYLPVLTLLSILNISYTRYPKSTHSVLCEL